MKKIVYRMELISDLKLIKEAIIKAEKLGATIMEIENSGDKIWNYEWLTFYKVISNEERKQEEIQNLENKLKKLKK